MNEVVLELGLSSTVVRRHFMNLLDPDALSLVEMMLQRSGKGASCCGDPRVCVLDVFKHKTTGTLGAWLAAFLSACHIA